MESCQKSNKNHTETKFIHIDYKYVYIVQTELSNTLREEKSVNLIFPLKMIMNEYINLHSKILPDNSSLATGITYIAH
jgi:hypothetical protein